jgi:transposase
MEVIRSAREELEAVARRGQPGYVRIKALALLNVADGTSVSEVARTLRVSRVSVYRWQRRYGETGVAGLVVQAGRGRRSTVDLSELESFIRRSPRECGLRQTRWTLKALARVVPSLNGFSAFGVQKVLRRAGYRYKRGQPWVHSPDPHYEGKKGLWTKR